MPEHDRRSPIKEMKCIGIVICNYNKSDFVIKCIRSVLESNWKNFDIYVVDNASTDASVKRIQQVYPGCVTLLQNKSNLGGSGGFNTGIRRVLEADYEYLMCLDNDVLIDADAVEALYTFLQEHPKVGMVGAKVYHAQAPEYIQQFGLEIDFDHFCARTLYADVLDTEAIPEIVYCDTVAACAVMTPVRVIREIGLLPEDNFLYWDDMEWGYRIKLAGYQVAAYAGARVLHEMSAKAHGSSSFASYYHWRNAFHFFMRFTSKDRWDTMSILLLSTLFKTVYECMYCGKHEVARTICLPIRMQLRESEGRRRKGKSCHRKPYHSSLMNYCREYRHIGWRKRTRSLPPGFRNSIHKPDG